MKLGGLVFMDHRSTLYINYKRGVEKNSNYRSQEKAGGQSDAGKSIKHVLKLHLENTKVTRYCC